MWNATSDITYWDNVECPACHGTFDTGGIDQHNNGIGNMNNGDADRYVQFNLGVDNSHSYSCPSCSELHDISDWIKTAIDNFDIDDEDTENDHALSRLGL